MRKKGRRINSTGSNLGFIHPINRADTHKKKKKQQGLIKPGDGSYFISCTPNQNKEKFYMTLCFMVDMACTLHNDDLMMNFIYMNDKPNI